MEIDASGQAGRTPSVSIVLVNYKTPLQTTLCLRSLRRFTRYPCDVTVVDNRSDDASTEYLSRLPWIRLIRNEHAAPSHRNGLDLGVRDSTADIVVAMHTDTFVRREGWLETLVGYMSSNTMIVGTPVRVVLSSTPLTRVDAWRRQQKLMRRWNARGEAPRLITHCVLYRRELFKEHGQRFDHPMFHNGVYKDAGEFVQRYCEDHGLGIRTLTFQDVAPLFWHSEAATLNVVSGRRLGWKRRLRRWSFYRRQDIRRILADDSLDS